MSKNLGTAFENEVHEICRAYKRRNLIDLEKVSPPVRWTPKGLVYLKNPFLDFMGSWTARAGRTVCIEVKHTEKPSLGIMTADGLKPDQFTTMERWEKNGAAVGVLWGHDDKMAFVSIGQIRTRIEQGVKHIKWADCMKVNAGAGLVTWDFLPIMAMYYPAIGENAD